MNGYQMVFRVMGFRGGNWIMLASFPTYDQAVEKIFTINDGFQKLRIEKLWIPNDRKKAQP